MTWFDKIIKDKYRNLLFIPTRIAGMKEIINYELKQYMLLKESFLSIQFSCFEKGGSCFKRKGTMCCCNDCYAKTGHYERSDIIEQSDVATLNELFKQKVGFWTPEGCSLPYRLRSKTCVSYNCEKDNSPIRFIAHSMQNDLRNMSTNIRSQVAVYLSNHIMKSRVKNI